jgi:hypothetical protein
VNPKAESVEELKARRKNLHMGMCELLREDLAYKAYEKLSITFNVVGSVGRQIKESVLKEFDDQTREHESRGEEIFNQDEMYKKLSNEAIDGKTHALEKIDFLLTRAQNDTGNEATPDGMDQQLETAILKAALKDFTGLMRLRTDFPWDDVEKNNKTEIDLRAWDAATIPEWALREFVVCALGGNTVIRAVMIKGVRLELSQGWATTELLWSRNQAVKAVPATVWLVLRTCVGVTKLDIRCSC